MNSDGRTKRWWEGRGKEGRVSSREKGGKKKDKNGNYDIKGSLG